jgi:hypothetical protein
MAFPNTLSEQAALRRELEQEMIMESSQDSFSSSLQKHEQEEILKNKRKGVDPSCY